jgi:GDPmannose 4,6-dehydratase
MWLMLQQDTPDDFVIGTGEAHSVREFVQLAFEAASLDWRSHVEIDPRYFRPAEVDYLLADSSKARNCLAWEPSIAFPELVQIMVQSDVREIEARLRGGAAALRCRSVNA